MAKFLGYFPWPSTQKHRLEEQISDYDLNVIRERLKDAKYLSESVDLTMSVKAADRALKLTSEKFTFGSVHFILAELHGRIEDELESVEFLLIPPGSVSYYQNPNSFGEAALSKIAGIDTDVAEAGSCLATGRFTACVFHLMRIMERGTQELGNKLGVQFTGEKNWQNILDEVNRAIRQLNPQTPQDKAVRDNYSAASAHLQNVKEAWRNRVMHPKQTYTQEEAKAVFDNVKTFIGYLAQSVL